MQMQIYKSPACLLVCYKQNLHYVRVVTSVQATKRFESNSKTELKSKLFHSYGGAVISSTSMLELSLAPRVLFRSHTHRARKYQKAFTTFTVAQRKSESSTPCCCFCKLYSHVFCKQQHIHMYVCICVQLRDFVIV